MFWIIWWIRWKNKEKEIAKRLGKLHNFDVGHFGKKGSVFHFLFKTKTSYNKEKETFLVKLRVHHVTMHKSGQTFVLSVFFWNIWYKLSNGKWWRTSTVMLYLWNEFLAELPKKWSTSSWNINHCGPVI